MGIKTLNPFLKDKCPDAFRDLPYSYFKGKRVAVDSDYVLTKLMSRAHKEIVNQTDVCIAEPDRQDIIKRWLYHLQEEINKFLKFGITLIFVFDGIYIDEKSETQTKRRESKQKLVNAAQEMKDKVLELDELERTPQMITELRKKMHHLGKVHSEEKDLVKEILKAAGFPVLMATGEGEKLCAMMGIEGLVDAVYSKDSDVIAMGCPVSFGDEAGWVYNKESGRTEMAVKSIFFKPILGALNMEYETFLDLCIMAGCDFNSNIPQLAVKKAYKLLSEHKNIDELPSGYDEKKKILNHVRCREIFSREKAKDICQTELELNMNKKIDEVILKQNGLTEWISELRNYYSNFPEPSNIFIEKIPSQKSSNLRMRIINNKKIPNDNNIPKQVASPKKIKQDTIVSLNTQQLENYKIRMQIE